MSLENLRKRSAPWNCFSKVDTLGSFDFWTLTVSLDSLMPNHVLGIDAADFPQNKTIELDMADYERKRKVLPLAAHEFTHFIDATATVWGINHLLKLDEVYSASISNEGEFVKLKRTFDYMRLIRLPKYYTTVDKAAPSTKPWRSNVTNGLLFNKDGSIGDRPVIFVRFWNSDGASLARSPISMVSLLEASAMSKEIEIRIELLRKLPAAERLVEERLMNDELMDYIYNKEITEYSVCFHLLANVVGSSDLGVTSRAVGLLVRIILNMPDVAFVTAGKGVSAFADKIKIPYDSLEVVRLKQSLEQRNHGAMFFLLVVLLGQGGLNSLTKFRLSLNAALKSIGLSSEKLRRAAVEEVSGAVKSLRNSKSSSLRAMADASLKNFNSIYPNNLHYPLSSLSLPSAVLGDLSVYSFQGAQDNLLKDYDIDQAYGELLEGQDKAEVFAEGCV